MVKQIALLILISLLGFGAWFSEIYLFDDWFSLHWLHRPIYSAFVGTLLAAALPIYFLHRSKKHFLSYTALLWFTNIVLYYFGKKICFLAFGRFGIMVLGGPYGFLFACILGYFVQASVFYFLVRKMGYVFKFYWVALFTFLGLLALPLSFLSLEWLGSPGAEGGVVDAIKMGYPVFWSIFIPGIIAIWIRYKEKASA